MNVPIKENGKLVLLDQDGTCCQSIAVNFFSFDSAVFDFEDGVGNLIGATEVIDNISLTPFPVPEPSTALLLFAGLATLSARRKRKP